MEDDYDEELEPDLDDNLRIKKKQKPRRTSRTSISVHREAESDKN